MGPVVVLLRKLAPFLLAALLAGCGAGADAAPTATPAPAGGALRPELLAGYEAALAGDLEAAAALLAPLAAGDAEAAELLATVRLGQAVQEATARPGDVVVARRALDRVSLALPQAAQPELRRALTELQGALLALLTTEDARLALEELSSSGAPPAEQVAAARALAERAEALAANQTLAQGGAAATAFLSAASALEAAGGEAGRAEARAFCERAAALAPDDQGARDCLARSVAQLEPTPLAAGGSPQAPAPSTRPRPAPPAAPAFTVARRTSFDGSGNSGQYASCVDVQILGPAGPVSGAVIGINNGEHSYQNQTDGEGYAGRCGLGASTWSVVLFWTPAGSVKGAATTVYLNGAPEQRAAVVFQGR